MLSKNRCAQTFVPPRVRSPAPNYQSRINIAELLTPSPASIHLSAFIFPLNSAIDVQQIVYAKRHTIPLSFSIPIIPFCPTVLRGTRETLARTVQDRFNSSVDRVHHQYWTQYLVVTYWSMGNLSGCEEGIGYWKMSGRKWRGRRSDGICGSLTVHLARYNQVDPTETTKYKRFSMPSYQELLTIYLNKNFDSSHLVPLGALVRLYMNRDAGTRQIFSWWPKELISSSTFKLTPEDFACSLLTIPPLSWGPYSSVHLQFGTRI